MLRYNYSIINYLLLCLGILLKYYLFFVSINNSIELYRDCINKYLEGENINIFILY